MTDAKWVWRLGGAAAFCMAVATGAVLLARTPYQLRVRVVDANGALAGAWVSFGERDVVLTDAQGAAVFKGRRYALDSALLTVTDPRLEPAHLSKTLRTEVSWIPWVRQSELEVFLPIIAASDSVALGGEPQLPERGSSQDFPIDLPPSATPPLLPEFTELNEDELVDVSAGADFGLKPQQWQLLTKSLEQGRTFEWSCVLLGLNTDFCKASSAPEKVMMLHADVISTSIQNSPDLSVSDKKIREVELDVVRPEVAVQTESRKEPEPVGQLSVDKPVRIEALFEGKPLERALVFMSRIRDNRVRELGETRSDGSLQVKIPSDFWGETVTIFHDCCAPRTFPARLTRVGGEQRLRLELQKGNGVGVLVQQEAYGHLRKIPQFEILSRSGKLSVSGQDGFALYNSSKTPEQIPSRVAVRKARPSEFFIGQDDPSGAQVKPMNFLVAAEEPYLPAMAVLEKNEGRSFQGILKSSGLRRWRRDFMARLMQQSTIKTVVSGEAESRIASAGESATDIVARGWQQTHLAGEWDFVLSLDYNDSEQSVRVAASNPEGRLFFEKEAHFGKDATAIPERISRQFFQDFVESFPFEAHVLRQEGDVVELSFNAAANFGLRESSPLALFQQSTIPGESKLSELAALAVVLPGEDGQNVRARITHWNSRVRKTRVLPDVVRATKVNPEFYKRESNRNAMAKSAGAGIGKAL